MMNWFDLSGKTAIVTGGSTGLGSGMSLGLASAGADIVLVDHRERDEVASQIRKMGRKVLTLHGDLSQMAVMEQVVNATLDNFGKVDILVNNAGIIRRKPAIDFSEKDWDDVMDLNAKTVFFLSQLCARDMMKRNYGKIINIASLLSFSGGITVPSYAASKGAVAQITKALANEWAKDGICINAIAPGYMVTDNTKALRENPERNSAISARIPAERWGTPADLAGVAIFLASKASDYVNGHLLTVDGGWMAR
ncbi:MAG: 2-dehydro-3-deoxy-D-gluconate 5-dehydrogenase KduD [Calditrichaeota bacterium]|nr:2-dehydro-3-deoxy-D-gluconate 5-dehydrogenase KduD [Calditrichota bacterium]MCB0270082.1 2-dehydro-3-deoxy-D-gluconate 5-dehydrogenase KduD [Calditrichota bacterium]MCB0286753.1 2-dehydro-3-deoxy-D-gluconate 5-dehydrogenase KduD [Calditrichota bacterium]MCB9069037.1 2-dehydro-3-deoxy-D-gluconate 5-dehydrogenase KduD [Calditrichia bacterium]